MSPSGLSVHDSARLLPIFCPGIGRTSASWSAYSIPKGVICGGGGGGAEQGGGVGKGPGLTAPPPGGCLLFTPPAPPRGCAGAPSRPARRRCDGGKPGFPVFGAPF